MKTTIYFLKCLLNDIFHVTDTDIFASFIREMIYKRHILCHQTCQKKGFSALQENYLLLFHYINMLTYCVGYKDCLITFMFYAE